VSSAFITHTFFKCISCYCSESASPVVEQHNDRIVSCLLMCARSFVCCVTTCTIYQVEHIVEQERNRIASTNTLVVGSDGMMRAFHNNYHNIIVSIDA
jgi:hypothetical protein